ncbi:deoxynucleotidyltransferase terminal-interacting protein 1-like isoform X3 [Amphiura filiformis]|uniref:deoxynucleotidyltransferase terminal-interacting protein 1-like isoform X3 n=1 Tax=Amphiura filiformis TaxID=82378 RepID=UPI003B21DF5E
MASMNPFLTNLSMQQALNMPAFNNMEIKEPPPQAMPPQIVYHSPPAPPPSPPKPTVMKNPYCTTLKTFPAHKHHRVSRQPDMSHKTRSGGSFNPQMSLEFLRCTLQKRINKDIQKVFQHYAQYFQLAVDNIRENHGEDSVSDDHVLAVYRNSLEAAKEAFMPHGKIYRPEFVQAHGDGLHYKKKIKNEKLWMDSPQGSPASTKQDQSEGTTFSMRPAPTIQTRKRKGRPPVHHKDYTDEIPTTGTSGYKSNKVRSEFVRREGPKWDPARLTSESLFVMGARANKALGLGATRGRLYIKHPDLFKYSGDSDDKQWLYEHQLMPATGGKAYMLLLEDIRDLAQSDEYRSNDGLLMHQLSGFHVPDLILGKMKRFMEESRTDGSQSLVMDEDAASSDAE